MRNMKHIKNIIVKIGTSSLCDDNGVINHEKMLHIIQQVAIVKRKGIKVTIVTSGAIGAGVGVLGLSKRPSTIPQKQALAAVGQASLMKSYEDIFKLFNIYCAQILVNHDDFDDRKRLSNLCNAMHAIIDYGAIAIINENDTLAVEEIKVGDNDTLAALMVPIVDADLLVLISDIDGLYNDNPHTNKEAVLIHQVEGIDESIKAMAKDTSSKVGTGGMATKINAAKIVNDYGCDMAIINSNSDQGLVALLEGKQIGTYFNGKAGKTLSSRKHWLLHRSLSKGKIIVDFGAKEALCKKHTSLLPKGIVDIDGIFMPLQVVEVADPKGNVIARGISNYSSDEIKRIKGLNSSEIIDVLEHKEYDEVIHANNMVIIEEE